MVTIPEGDVGVGHINDSAVGDGNSVGVTSKIIDGIAKAVKGFLNEGTPVGFVEHVNKMVKEVRLSQFIAGIRDVKLPETFFCFADVPVQKLGIDMLLIVRLLWEEPAPGFTVSSPVFSKNIQGTRRKRDVTVRAVLCFCDMDAHIFAGNVFIPQGAGFASPKPGRIHEGKNGSGKN